MRLRRPRAQLLFASAVIFTLAAGPSFAQSEPNDPWEKTNRRLFGLEETLDRHIFGPLARTYGQTPSAFRKAVMNFTRNLGEPVVFINDVLQGHIGQAATTLGRMSINTIFGVAGFIDVAKHNRIPHHDNTFGTTLGRWGAKPGPYLFLPLVGPTTIRDAFGSVVDIGINPMTYTRYPGQVGVQVTTTAASSLNTRVEAQTQLDTIRQTSTDPYATIRSYFWQNRAAEITGKEVNIEALPDFDSTPATTPAPAGSVSPTPAPPVSSSQPAAPSPAFPGAAGALPRPEAVPSPGQSGAPGAPAPSEPAPSEPAPATPPSSAPSPDAPAPQPPAP